MNPFLDPPVAETPGPTPPPFDRDRTVEDPVPSHDFRAASLLDVRGLGVSPGGSEVAALDGITLSVSHGESLGLVGDPDAGTVALALAIAGRLPEGALIETGSILLDGVELVGLGRRPAARLLGDAIGYLPANPLTSFDLTRSVRSQLAGALRKRLGLPSDVARQQVLDLLDLVGVVDPAARARQYPQDLNLGDLHRVALAAVFSGDPALVVAVSPGAGLDGEERAAHTCVLRELWRNFEFALLVASGDVEVVEATCDRVAVFEAGRITLQGSVAEIRSARYGVKSAMSEASITSASTGLVSME